MSQNENDDKPRSLLEIIDQIREAGHQPPSWVKPWYTEPGEPVTEGDSIEVRIGSEWASGRLIVLRGVPHVMFVGDQHFADGQVMPLEREAGSRLPLVRRAIPPMTNGLTSTGPASRTRTTHTASGIVIEEDAIAPKAKGQA